MWYSGFWIYFTLFPITVLTSTHVRLPTKLPPVPTLPISPLQEAFPHFIYHRKSPARPAAHSALKTIICFTQAYVDPFIQCHAAVQIHVPKAPSNLNSMNPPSTMRYRAINSSVGSKQTFVTASITL